MGDGLVNWWQNARIHVPVINRNGGLKTGPWLVQLMMAMEVKPRRIQFSGGLIQESHEDFIGFKLEGSV